MKEMTKPLKKYVVFAVWFFILLLVVPGYSKAQEPAQSAQPVQSDQLAQSAQSATAASGITVDLARLGEYFEAARQAWKIPGIAVAIVKDGQVVLAKGYGVREYAKEEKVDEKTLFAIASNTKAFTAATLAMLVDEGKISWDDKVREYLPYFKLYDPYITEEITVRDLLCHRSGLKTFSGDMIWYETTYSPEEVIKRARYLKPVLGFRGGFGYSNIMFVAASEIVPAVTGTPWKDFVTERIFKPLGMETSNLGTTALKAYANVSSAHYVYPDGKTVVVPYTPSDNLGGAAAINSNAVDMAQWIKMLLNNGLVGEQKILSEKSIWEMWSAQMAVKVSKGYTKLFPSTHFRDYGLGWGLSDYLGYKVVAHGGALDGMISQVAMVPEINLGMVILTNSINRLPTALMYKIIDTYVGAPDKDWSGTFLAQTQEGEKEDMELAVKLPAKKPKGKEEIVDLRDFSGVYSCVMYGDAKVSIEKNKLILDLLPAPVFISDLTYMYHDIFQLKFRNTFSFVPHGTGTVQFIRDKSGKVVEMKIDVPNHDFWFDELEFKKKPDEEMPK